MLNFIFFLRNVFLDKLKNYIYIEEHKFTCFNFEEEFSKDSIIKIKMYQMNPPIHFQQADFNQMKMNYHERNGNPFDNINVDAINNLGKYLINPKFFFDFIITNILNRYSHQ